MSVERLIERLENVLDDCIDSISSIQRSVLNNAIKYLSDITDVLGDTYDLDRLRELVEADKAGRCIVLPEVNRKAKSVFSDSLHDVFSEWSYSDPSVGINGMSDDERKLASAIMAALAKEEEQCDVK